MKLIVDRFEGNYAVCQDYDSGKMIDLEISIFPEEVRSGDLVDFSDGKITILPSEDLRKEIQAEIDSLWN